MKLLVIAEPAARDLESIVDYIAQDNPTAAENTYRLVQVLRERFQGGD